MAVPQPERITSRRNPLLVAARELAHEPAAYRRLGRLLLEGEHLCETWSQRAARPGTASHRAADGGEAGRPEQALLTDAGWAEPRLRRLAAPARRIVLLDAATMRGVSSFESPPPIAFIVAAPAATPIAAAAATLVLDAVQDPGNAGTLLRSAAAFGLTQAIALPGTAAVWSPKVLRAAMGAHFSLNVVEAAGLDALDLLAVPLLGTSSHAPTAIDAVALPWPCAWAFGSEGRGLSAAVQARCARVVSIAQPGGGESLNVAAAAAVALYESARQRQHA